MLEESSPSCTFHPLAIDAWIFVVTYHGICLGGLGIPIALWTYYVGRRHPQWCLALAVIAPFSISLFLNYGGSAAIGLDLSSYLLSESSLPIVWIGPFLASTFGFSTGFKLWNVAFQQHPEGADASLLIFVVWFLILPEPKFVKGKTRTLTSAEIQQHIWRFSFKIVVLSVVLSVLQSPSLDQATKHNESVLIAVLKVLPTKGETLLQEAWNGWLHLWFLYMFVSLCLELSIILIMPLTGFQEMEPAFQNPLLESRSFQEVWGTRWNLPVQVLLQRTSYIPLRKNGYNRSVAALATFVVSGLLHEYNFYTHNFVAYRQPGVATCFFVLMGLLMLAEKWFWNRFVPQSLQKAIETYVPSFVIAFGDMMVSAIPVERYFMKSWLEAGFVEAVASIIPHITCR